MYKFILTGDIGRISDARMVSHETTVSVFAKARHTTSRDGRGEEKGSRWHEDRRMIERMAVRLRRPRSVTFFWGGICSRVFGP